MVNDFTLPRQIILTKHKDEHKFLLSELYYVNFTITGKDELERLVLTMYIWQIKTVRNQG